MYLTDCESDADGNSAEKSGEIMLSIVAIVTLVLALIACSVVRRREARFAKANQGATRRSSIAALAMPIIYVPILIIATRFGARTFPGIWMPNNPLLNEITQGGIFYIAAAAAILCGVIDLFRKPPAGAALSA